MMPSRPHGQPYASPHFPVEDEEGVEEEGEEFEESSAEDELSDEDDETEFHDSHLPMIVLPLYSLLSRAQQCKVCVAKEYNTASMHPVFHVINLSANWLSVYLWCTRTCLDIKATEVGCI